MIHRLLTFGLLLCLSLQGVTQPALPQEEFERDSAVLARAKACIQVLCSEALQGRGAAGNGDSLAADYLEGRFAEIGLEPLGDILASPDPWGLKSGLELSPSLQRSYGQELTYPVNTFSDPIDLRIDGELLEPGTDYLVHPASPACSGRFSVFPLTKAQVSDREHLGALLQRASGKMLLIDRRQWAAEERGAEPLVDLAAFLDFVQWHDKLDIAGLIELTDDKLSWGVSPEVAMRPRIQIRAEAVSRPKTAKLKLSPRLVPQHKARNIIGRLPGKLSADPSVSKALREPAEVVLITAHYDHLGRMGKALFPGANDNASGTAMLLELAQSLAASPDPPSYDLVFVAFAGEEAGLAGSRHFVAQGSLPLEQIRLVINLDILGTGDEGIQVVNATVQPQAFGRLVALNDSLRLLPAVKSRGERCNSDHCPFHEASVPALFIYTLGGAQWYHDVYDRPEVLSLSAFTRIRRLLLAFLQSF